ncbi:hypothetical protein OQA88_3068 [Cercophora sp. LCS_1]
MSGQPRHVPQSSGLPLHDLIWGPNDIRDPGRFWCWTGAAMTQKRWIPGVTNSDDYEWDAEAWGDIRKSNRVRTPSRHYMEHKFPSANLSKTLTGRVTKNNPSSSNVSHIFTVPAKGIKTSALNANTRHANLMSTLPAQAANLLRPSEASDDDKSLSELNCQYCKEPAGSDKCGIHCFRAMHNDLTYVRRWLVELKDTPNRGVGAFAATGETLQKDVLLGLYLGKLVPPTEDHGSSYVFSVGHERRVAVDGEKHGGWTRFLNSNCDWNVDSHLENIGGMLFIALRTNRVIQPGEELTIFYGRDYFMDGEQKMPCCCDAKPYPHIPPLPPKKSGWMSWLK